MQLILPINGPLHKILVHVYSIWTHKRDLSFVCVKKYNFIYRKQINGGWEWGLTGNRHEGTFWDDGDILKRDCSDGCITTNLLKNIDECILWYFMVPINYRNNYALKITYWHAKNSQKTWFYHTRHIHCFLKNLLWTLLMSTNLDP